MSAEHLDVLIVGAGLSGVGAACHLSEHCPGKTFALLEARDSLGGTWDLFRYPGIRSDSDMFTLGYSFRPWREAKAIADGPAILRYIRETARDHGIESKIRLRHRVVSAKWSSEESRWTVEAQRADSGETVTLTCGFLYVCSGYYRYDQGYTPPLPGRELFRGPVVHPQQWPEELDYEGRRVLVIGSGATAFTLVPAMAGKAAHVTMLQRSPSYVLSLPARDPLADRIRRRLPERSAYGVVRWKNMLITTLFYRLSRRAPRLVRRLIRRGVERSAPPGYDVDTHFNPRYSPWDQRVCLVPDGDFFAALRREDASVVTGELESFTEDGVRLTSGQELQADVVVTATGLNLQALGGMSLTVDGRDVVLPDTVGYKGMMLSDVPNMALTLGYTNASWTLKADLVAAYICRLLNHMDERGYVRCTPRAPGPAVARLPFIDLKSGYVLRSLDSLPRQGARAPWRLHQNYVRDFFLLRFGRLEDEGIEFAPRPLSPAGTARRVRAAAAAVLAR